LLYPLVPRVTGLRPIEDALAHHGDPGGVFVEAGDHVETFAAGVEEDFPPLNIDFLEGFKAIGDERGADDEELFNSLGREAFEGFVGVGGEPGVSAETGLEGGEYLVFGDTGVLGECLDGTEALVAITGAVGGVADFTAIGSLEAVAVGGVAFDEVAFGDTVKAEEDFVVVLFQIRLCTLVEGVDVVLVLIEGLEQGPADVGGFESEFFLYFDHHGFVAGHGVVRIHGKDEELFNALLYQSINGVGYGGGAVAHGELDGEVDLLLELFGEVLAGDDERRAFIGPDGGVGFGGLFGAKGEDKAADDEVANGRGCVDDTGVEQEFFEVAAYVGDGGGIRGAKV